MAKSIQEINEKISKGTVRVLTAAEMTGLVKVSGLERAAEEIDVVTTGTFGAMCSSGVWFNFGHSEPPIKMIRVWLNDVEAYAGVAAVDAYLGVTQPSTTRGMAYSGAHVICDLLQGKKVRLRAESYGTDCYPRREIETDISLDDLNQALMSNPRNAYQRYNAAANSSSRELQTYMGRLLADCGNVTFSGAGELSPLMNDPGYRTIGIGTRIFLGGAIGYINGHGTQHNPKTQFGTLMVQGNLREMSPEYLQAAVFSGYGASMYIGIGIPIPVLDLETARATAIADADIKVNIMDYAIQSRSRPVLGSASFAELKSGQVEIAGRKVPTAPLSSFAKAAEIAATLKQWIRDGKFLLTQPVERLPVDTGISGLHIKKSDACPGIETSTTQTVFMSWKAEKCMGCGQCLLYCGQGVFSRQPGWRVGADPVKCISCGSCRGICPVGAITTLAD